MIGELIPTGVTFGTGRISVNDQFSGTAEFNDVEVSGNLSAGTGGVIYSGGTDLYSIFLTNATDATTASNGLTKSGDNITLGGQISGDTIISLSGISTFVMSGDSGNFEQIKIQSSFINSEPASLIVGKGSAGLYSESGSSSINSYVSVSSASAIIGREIGALNQQIAIDDSSGMYITDTKNSRGITYVSNYHTNYTNRSLVDKQYVDLAVASGGGGVKSYLNLGTTGSTINWNVSGLSTNYQVTLSAATTLNLTGVRNGEYGTIIVTQDGVGGRTITLGAVNGLVATHKVINGGGGVPTLTSTASATDILSFTYNGSAMYWTVGNDYT